MGKKWLIAVSLYFVVQILVLSNCYAQDQRFRGVWLTDVCSNVLDSDENIRTAVRQCKETKINHIFVAVWNRGQTIYPSNVVKSITGVEIMNRFKGRDPLSVLIKEAHNVGIKVHAWFEFGFSSSYDDSPVENRDFITVKDVNDMKMKMESMKEDEIREISANAMAWFDRACTPDALWGSVKRVIDEKGIKVD
jgi:uncharacterized lipoprotein YddW (UPF0748 family)